MWNYKFLSHNYKCEIIKRHNYIIFESMAQLEIKDNKCNGLEIMCITIHKSFKAC
jgi:hypothetical protein